METTGETMPFVKLDCKILDKSIWRESAETKVVWITLLAMADSDGLVEASIMGVSDRARVSLEETEKAIEKFLAPDPYSTNPANDGRRIERVVGGFNILNYEIYRQKDHTAAARMRKHREALRVTGVTLQAVYASVSEVLSYLNSKTGKKYKNTKYIEARIRDGYTVEQLKGVIDLKMCDPHFIEHKQYLNPVTLFRPSHIDNYINQSPNDFGRRQSRRPDPGESGREPSPPPQPLTPQQEREQEIRELRQSIRNAEIFLGSPGAKKDANSRAIVQRNLEQFTAKLKEMGA
jgi:uncharacterized phage protein (TIGR02220 family)